MDGDGDGDGASASPVQGPATNWEVFHFPMSSVAPFPYVTASSSSSSSSSSSTLLYHDSPVTVAARDQFVGSFRNQGQLSAAMALQSKFSDMMSSNSGASHGIWPSPPGQLNGGSGPFPPNLAPDPGFAERAARFSSFNGGGGGGVMQNSGLAPTFSLPSDLGNMTRSSPSRSHTSSPHRPPHLGGGGEPHVPPLHYHHHYPRQLSRSVPSSPTFANSSSRINPFLLPTQHYPAAGTPPDLPRHEPPTLTASLDLASGPLAAVGFRSAGGLPPTTEAAPALTSAHINAAPSALYATVGQDREIRSLPAAEQEPHSSAATRANGGKKRKVGLKSKSSSKSAVVQKNADGAADGAGEAEAKRCKGAASANVEGELEAINCDTMAMGVELAGEQSNTNHEEDSAASGSALKEYSSITAMTPDPPKQDYIHVRARRGQATDSHSLAERVRREKISDRMKFLQDLVPGCNKVTGKAVMLDEIINYVQSLQRQVEFLSMKLSTVSPTSKLEGLLSNNGTVLMSELQSQNLLPNKMMALFSNYNAPAPHLPANSHHLVNHHQHQTTDLDHAEPLQPSTAAPYINEQDVPLPLLLTDHLQQQQPQAWEDELQSIVQMGFPTLS